MTAKKHDKALHLDMPFEEALGRFAQTKPREVKVKKDKKTKKIPSRAGGAARDIAAKDLPKSE
jgi:hypothetical protein